MKFFTIISEWGEDESIVKDSIKNGYDETKSISIWRFLATSLDANSLVIDVGGYVGFYSIIAALENSGIKSIAFEPSTTTYGRLQTNILLNQLDTRVIPMHLAVGSSSGELLLKHRYGVYSITSGDSAVFDFEPDFTEKVDMIKLDNLLAERQNLPGALSSSAISFRPFSSVDLIKIDVEGAELSVLEGAIQIIERYQPFIIAEALDKNAEIQLLEFANKMNYEFEGIDNERNVLLVAKEKFSQFKTDYNEWIKRQQDLSLKFTRNLIYSV